jgi:Holliday junction resolvase
VSINTAALYAIMKEAAMTKYNTGRRFEYRVRDYFEQQGYLVFRSAGSRSPADLFIVKEGEFTLVQCKVNRRSLSKAEREQMAELAKELNCKAVLAYREGRRLRLEEIS